MYPIWVIRASRPAFALRPNRRSTFDHCLKRPPSAVIFPSLVCRYSLLSPLWSATPGLRPANTPFSLHLTILHIAIFSNSAACLQESAHVATVLKSLSTSRPCYIHMILVQAGHSDSHILISLRPRISNPSIHSTAQCHRDEFTSRIPLLLLASRR
jgi:hypothetical protein